MAVEMHMLSVDHLLSLPIFHSNLVYTSSLSLRFLSNAFSMRWKQCSVIGQLSCPMDLELINRYMWRHATSQFFHFTHVRVFYVSECGWPGVNTSSIF